MRRRLKTILLPIVGATLALGAVPGVASAASWQFHQTDGDALFDAVSMDADANGCIEDIYFDIDNDGGWDSRLYNRWGGDCFVEVLTFDMNENGRPEYRMVDVDQKPGFERLSADPDQNGRWNWTRIIPGSTLDYATRINRYNVTRDQMFLFRRTTGQSLIYPNIPSPY